MGKVPAWVGVGKSYEEGIGMNCGKSGVLILRPCSATIVCGDQKPEGNYTTTRSYELCRGFHVGIALMLRQ